MDPFIFLLFLLTWTVSGLALFVAVGRPRSCDKELNELFKLFTEYLEGALKDKIDLKRKSERWDRDIELIYTRLNNILIRLDTSKWPTKEEK